MTWTIVPAAAAGATSFRVRIGGEVCATRTGRCLTQEIDSDAGQERGPRRVRPQVGVE
jgi:hypothetical protein